jgi:hypothetical protein
VKAQMPSEVVLMVLGLFPVLLEFETVSENPPSERVIEVSLVELPDVTLKMETAEACLPSIKTSESEASLLLGKLLLALIKN